MALTRKFAYFCDIKCFKITGVMTDNHTRICQISRNLSQFYKIYKKLIQMQHKEDLVLLLI